MRTLSLRQLRSIQEISRLGTIAAAARSLGLTAPAITLQVKQMEEEFGLTLFDRTSDGMHLREAGYAALKAADAIETVLQGLQDDLDAIKGVRRGLIRLGVVSTAKYFAPSMIAGFRKDHPAIEIKLLVGNRFEIVEQLRAYELDIALMGRPPTEIPIEAKVFGDHPLVMIAAPGHPLAALRSIDKARLLQEPIIIREPGSGTRKSLETFFSAIPDALERNTTQMGSNETIKQAVMAGLGIAFISAHTIAFEVEMRRLVILDVVDMPIRKQWFAVTRGDHVPAPAEKAFATFLSQKGATFLPMLDRLYPSDASRLER
ncbi:LysR substrate-binding domain-containing protein [Aureimonas glaciei]|uniref:HTH-type transcriptional regulator CbbR n=1 Tax=Aureimonas glaciei TaxID=1776957 RepID=A0A916XT66_9HYPH|nr:LysR substrate-binding domain-containing protein [Aureimonas glaciei]GGD07086.1 LysR family transcriptional regulator [Aureimonas glaciei]